MNEKPDILEKLTDFNKWNRGKDIEDHINLFDYATFHATPDLIFSFEQLFKPDLINYKGSYIFNYGEFDPEIYDQWEKKGLEPFEIERVMNHIHMFRVLQATPDLDFDIMKACADIIVSFWTKMFQDIGLVGEVFGNDTYDLAITIHSKRS